MGVGFLDVRAMVSTEGGERRSSSRLYMTSNFLRGYALRGRRARNPAQQSSVGFPDLPVPCWGHRCSLPSAPSPRGVTRRRSSACRAQTFRAICAAVSASFKRKNVNGQSCPVRDSWRGNRWGICGCFFQDLWLDEFLRVGG